MPHARRAKPRSNPDSILDRIDPASVALGLGVGAILWYVFLRQPAAATTTSSTPPGGTPLPRGGVQDGTQTLLNEQNTQTWQNPQGGAGGAMAGGALSTDDRLRATLTAAEAQAADATLPEADRQAARDLAVQIRAKLAAPHS